MTLIAHLPTANNGTAGGAGWPRFEQDEIDAATCVLRSGKVNYWTGSEGRSFEREFAAYIGSKYAIALANGTVALELALQALDIGPGDEVITSSRTFIASASCAVMRGATPVIADVDPISQNLTADTVKQVLSPNTKAIIAVHLAGWPCDMDPLMDLAREHNIKVIEDCAQAHGATYRGRKVGSIGDVGAFSFCQDKVMTTGGEGGMLTLSDEHLWKRAWAFKDHGKSYDAVHKQDHPPGFRWLHESFGTNWRMTEMQAAIGRVQLRKLPKWLELRRKHAAILTEGLSRVPGLRVTAPPPDVEHAYYKYYAFIHRDRIRSGADRQRVVDAVNAQGVPCYSGTCSEIYREQAFVNAGLGPAEPLPVSRELGETSLMFLVHPTLSEQDMHRACIATDRAMNAYYGQRNESTPVADRRGGQLP